jgi:deoxyribodipyrimidine photo-lyase
MKAAPLAAPAGLQPVPEVELGAIPSHADSGLPSDARAANLQRGGVKVAHQVWQSFIADRGVHYRGGISSPLSAESACSRLSPYLTWGNLTSRQIIHDLRNTYGGASPRWEKSLRAFESRMHWRCHLIQKLEDEPRIEFENLIHAYDGLRESEFDAAKFAAWCVGETGYPMIDACMRSLRATGWLNFRMRSMLVAFAAYDLWLHWREPALFLARQFLDYEPGIHYPQMQMQAGTAGHATIRLYNPVKQGQDHDPTGEFIRRWIPALERFPTSFIHAPWLLPREQQVALGCVIGKDYPAPIVNHDEAVAHARQRIAAFRRNPRLAGEVAAVSAKHGSRRLMPERIRRQVAVKQQLRLF